MVNQEEMHIQQVLVQQANDAQQDPVTRDVDTERDSLLYTRIFVNGTFVDYLRSIESFPELILPINRLSITIIVV